MTASQTRELPLLDAGFECSDPDSFYSSTTGGFRNHAHRDPEDADRTILELAHGKLAYTAKIEADALRFDVEVLDDTLLYDLVCRWVFPGSVAVDGELGGEVVPRGSLLYHQHACDTVRLGDLQIDLVGADRAPPCMSPELYLRCECDESDLTGYRWIVHARLIARPGEELWLKHIDGTSRRFEGSAVERAILMRRRELAAPIYETQIQPHARLLRGTRCRIGLKF